MSRKDVTDALVCKAVAEWHGGGGDRKWPYELLSEWTGEAEKVCLAAMERSADEGLIEYGVSLRTAWLTDKGAALLAESP